VTSEELLDLAAKAQSAYDAMTPSQKLRLDYMQRRSFARGMAPWKTNFTSYCAAVDEMMPDEKVLTDAEIGLALIGKLPRRKVEDAA
jgi:hypothetical protein